jgi:hypothetical protein
VANRHRFIHLREKSVVPCSGVQNKLPRDPTNRMSLAKIDWESLLRAAKRDKDLRRSARAAIQGSRIDFASGFPERFARQFAALSVAGGPVNSQ